MPRQRTRSASFGLLSVRKKVDGTECSCVDKRMSITIGVGGWAFEEWLDNFFSLSAPGPRPGQSIRCPRQRPASNNLSGDCAALWRGASQCSTSTWVAGCMSVRADTSIRLALPKTGGRDLPCPARPASRAAARAAPCSACRRWCRRPGSRPRAAGPGPSPAAPYGTAAPPARGTPGPCTSLAAGR